MNSHGTAKSYNAGCRCDHCRQAITEYARQVRRRRLARRVLLGGRLVAPLPAEKHGNESTYRNWGCRCVSCTAANRAMVKDCNDVRRAARVQVGDRLVAIGAQQHGSSSTYRNHGCRCDSCCEAERAVRARRRSQVAS